MRRSPPTGGNWLPVQGRQNSATGAAAKLVHAQIHHRIPLKSITCCPLFGLPPCASHFQSKYSHALHANIRRNIFEVSIWSSNTLTVRGATLCMLTSRKSSIHQLSDIMVGGAHLRSFDLLNLTQNGFIHADTWSGVWASIANFAYALLV